MRRILVECAAKDCLHHDEKEMTCAVSNETYINIFLDGRCLDLSPVTDDEYKMITGRDRMSEIRDEHLQSQLTEARKNLNILLKDTCDNDSKIRELCKPFTDVTGDSYEVPDIVTVVEEALAKLLEKKT
jgi:hypothetical protein